MREFLPAAAAAATGVQVGAAIVATRFVIGETAPASLALLRYAIGFLCLVPPLALAGRTRIARRDLLPIGLLGIVQFGVLIAALNYGLSLVPSARAALLFATFPLMTVVVGMAFGEERPTTAKTAGVLLTIIGVGLAIGESGLGSGSAPDDWRGDAAVLSSALAGAICTVLYRPYLRKYPTLPVSAVAMLASVGFLALLAAGEGFFNAFPHFTGKGWLAVLFIGVSSGVGYYLWLWALGRTTPTRVTVFLGLSPITATALGALLLGEPVSLTFAAGLACIVLGLWIAHREPTT